VSDTQGGTALALGYHISPRWGLPGHLVPRLPLVPVSRSPSPVPFPRLPFPSPMLRAPAGEKFNHGMLRAERDKERLRRVYAEFSTTKNRRARRNVERLRRDFLSFLTTNHQKKKTPMLRRVSGTGLNFSK